MVDFILVLLLIFGLLMGLKRGLILQVFHLIGFIVSFVIAIYYYKKLASKLVLFIPYPDLSDKSSWADFLQALPLETAFYNAIAFVIIFFAAKIALQIIASMLDFVASLPILNSVNKLLGALLGFIEVYLLSFITLFLLALTPVDAIQQYINNSSVALFIIEKTPVLSKEMVKLWMNV
ncbi:CvpA family protein [Virgibacillus soli]|uniref:CvpA family protein n=1 Tax=Paracerasibacillus soli TaxID=480284 RepID=A0ABU5CS14_9BACI|nr:CvpA family protein [Virgibacillus soli]MDY0408614.1 CvpA family protein [Virgibacillus soli]